MKKSILSLLCLTFAVGGFASCDQVQSMLGKNSGEEKKHVHTFATEWSKDAEGHWYDATCECEDVEVAKIAHVDANNDGACDICTFTDHTHTYQTEDWTADCTNHWHAATCGHVVAGTDVAAHADENKDGKCDVCGYVIEDIHVHVFDKEWSSDETNHWHAALCEHGAEVADKEAHNLNAAGDCTVCGAHVQDVDMTDIGAILAAATANNNKVVSGNVQYIYNIPDFGYSTSHNVYYVLGNDASYVKRYEYEAATQYWYERISEDEVFGVSTYDNGVTLEPVSAGAEHLNGYYYAASTLADATTLDGILSALYEFTKADTAKNVIAKYDEETGYYIFAYDYLSVNVTNGHDDLTDVGNDDSTAESQVVVNTSLFSVMAGFKVDANFVITEAAFMVGAYNKDIDGDYTYDHETGVWALTDNALADTYIFSVAQTAGERSYDTVYPKAAVVPNDFDIAYNDTVIEDSISVEKGASVSLALVNIKPFSAMANMITAEDLSISIVNKANAEDTLYSYYWGGAIGFYAKEVGEYTVTVNYGDVTKVIALTITNPTPTSVTVHPIYENSGWGDTWLEADEYTTATSVNLTVGETYDFAVKVNPSAAEQGYTVSVDSDNATVSDVTIGECIIFYEMMDSYVAKQFKADVAGTYVVTIASTADATVVGTLTVNVNDGSLDAPYGLDLGVNTLTISQDMVDNYYVYASFTAQEDGWYKFANESGYTFYLEDGYTNEYIETDVIYYYVAAGETIVGHCYVPDTTDVVLTVSLEEILTPSEGYGDCVCSGIDIYGAGSYGMTVDYDVCADGLWIDFYAWSDGYFEFVSSWGPNTITYDNAVYTAYGDNGNLLLYAEAGEKYTFLVDYIDYDAEWNLIETNGTFFLNVVEVPVLSEGDNSVVGTGDYSANVLVVVEETGSYVVTIEDLGEGSIYLYGDVSIDGYSWWGTSSYTTTVELEAGEVYSTTVYFPQDPMTYQPVTGAWKVTITAEGSTDGDDTTGDDDTTGGDTTVAITGDGSETNPYVVSGESSLVIAAGAWNPTFVQVKAGVTATLDVGAQFYTDPTDMSTSVGTSVTPDVDTLYYVYADSMAGATVQLTGSVGSSSGDDTTGDNDTTGGSVGYDTVLVAGANTLYFSADEVSANTATRECTITEAGNYQFASGNLFISAVTAADGTAIAKNDDYTYTLEAGSYTVTFGMLSMFGVSADTACELNVNLKVDEA